MQFMVVKIAWKVACILWTIVEHKLKDNEQCLKISKCKDDNRWVRNNNEGGKRVSNNDYDLYRNKTPKMRDSWYLVEHVSHIFHTMKISFLIESKCQILPMQINYKSYYLP